VSQGCEVLERPAAQGGWIAWPAGDSQPQARRLKLLRTDVGELAETTPDRVRTRQFDGEIEVL